MIDVVQLHPNHLLSAKDLAELAHLDHRTAKHIIAHYASIGGVKPDARDLLTEITPGQALDDESARTKISAGPTQTQLSQCC